MIGIILLTHAELGKEFIATIELITGRTHKNLVFVPIDIKEDSEVLNQNIQKAILEVKTNKGIIIFVDMYGGTPSNLGYQFLEEDHIEVIAGLNLPILFKAVESREKKDLKELTKYLVEHGKKSISLGSDILNGKKG